MYTEYEYDDNCNTQFDHWNYPIYNSYDDEKDYPYNIDENNPNQWDYDD